MAVLPHHMRNNIEQAVDDSRCRRLPPDGVVRPGWKTGGRGARQGGGMRQGARRLIVIGAALGLCAGGWLPLRAQEAGAQYLIVTTKALAPGFADLASFRSSPEGGSLTVRMTTIEEI